MLAFTKPLILLQVKQLNAMLEDNSNNKTCINNNTMTCKKATLNGKHGIPQAKHIRYCISDIQVPLTAIIKVILFKNLFQHS
jgi:hypothetical protein